MKKPKKGSKNNKFCKNCGYKEHFTSECERQFKLGERIDGY